MECNLLTAIEQSFLLSAKSKCPPEGHLHRKEVTNLKNQSYGTLSETIVNSPEMKKASKIMFLYFKYLENDLKNSLYETSGSEKSKFCSSKDLRHLRKQ